VERDLIPPYYRAWEQERAHKRPAPDHLGGDLLHVITPTAPPPRPPGDLANPADLTDLAAVVRQWHTGQTAHTARTFEGVRA
jgi:hypothetical protein